MTARAHGLHLFAAGAFCELDGWRTSLPSAWSRTTLPASGWLLPDRGRGKRSQEHHHRET
jgi:hypothetical protein